MTEQDPGISLQGKVCIVTGAARGIGRAIASDLTRLGACVVINDIDREPLDEVVQTLNAAGGQVIGIASSVGTLEGGRKLTQAALEQWGRVDVLVNNAGVTRDAMFHKMTESEWDDVMTIHAKALFTCTQPVVQHIAERCKRDPEETGGSIICMSSTSGLGGNVGQTNYSAAKSAVLGFVMALAKELRRNGSRINAIAPSAWTRLTSAIPEEVLVKYVGEEGLRQMQGNRPEHIAPVVSYLASDASRGVTGQFIRVAGNNVGVFAHPAPKRSVAADEDWTVDTVAQAFDEQLKPALEPLKNLGDL